MYKNFFTYDIALLYSDKSFIDIKDFYAKLTNIYFLKIWHQDLESNLILNKNAAQFNEKSLSSINNSHLVVVCLTKSFLATEICLKQLKYSFEQEKKCLILLIDKIDFTDVLKNLFTNEYLKQSLKFEIIDFIENFNGNYKKWSGDTFHVLLKILNEILIENSFFLSAK
jgi:hypothetical protein